MGAYSVLRVGELEVESYKDGIDPAIMMLFVPSDKKVRLISEEDWERDYSGIDDWSADRCEIEYRCSIEQMVDRLELKGYTLTVARESFRLGARRRIRELTDSIRRSQELMAQHSPVNSSAAYVSMKTIEWRTVQILRDLTVEDWIAAIRGIRRSAEKITHVSYEDVKDLSPADQYARVWGWSKFGFPGSDPRCFLRLVLAAFDDSDVVSYDLTELVLNDCFDSEADLVDHAEYLISREYDINRATVVLTEGSTDRWVLERSMKLLYPHLAPFFSFMDFDGVRLEGGAGNLANMVKAFAGAKILNRVLAVFDNDTAGNSARESLKTVRLPQNIKVISLPAIAFANEYPTLGPNGLSTMDINGLACGIEVYLGTEALTGNDGEVVPVQWKGYDPRLKRYQGELLAKSEVLERFRKNLSACELDINLVDRFDWSGLRAILDILRTAFHEEDAAAHLEYEGCAESKQ